MVVVIILHPFLPSGCYSQVVTVSLYDCAVLWFGSKRWYRFEEPYGAVVSMLLRPRFTAMLWGCSMSLWPRILQHIGSKVDGEVSVAAMQLPAEAGPFLEAICALLLLYAARSAHPLTPRSASAEGVLCATKVYGARAVQTVATFQVSTSKLIVSITTS